MSQASNQVCLPRVRKVTLENFSLYTRQSKITNTFHDGVFCLAGANGLGKSTYLVAVNYGITGIVSKPDRSFASVEEFYKANIGFSSEFFEGRIDETDRDNAEVSLDLQVGDYTFALTRGMFEPEALRKLSIRNGDGKPEVFSPDDSSPGDLHRIYCDRIRDATGFKHFEQLAFLQHFVLTFDERRHLLFWDPKVLERALYLAFGGDYAQAHRADTLRRLVEKAGSWVRNYTWQAAEVRDKIKDLETTAKAVKSASADAELQSMFERLEKRCGETQNKLRETENKLRDSSLRVADLSSQQSVLRTQYNDEFAKRAKSGSQLQLHPLIAMSLREGHCHLCESEDLTTKQQIRARLDSGFCPICGVKLPQRKTDANLETLKKLDKELAKVAENLNDVTLKRIRLQKEFDIVNEGYSTASREFEQFVEGNKKQLAALQTRKASNAEAILEEYRRQLAEVLAKKDARKKERDELQDEFRGLQKRLQQQYSRLEERFVPLFKELAHSFLGLDLDIKLEAGASELNLVVEVKNTARREHHQLSESQRFFIDIALRMAFAQFISRPGDSTCLFIDTPEGSLDIAYETKAGEMFGRFVRSGFSILMTANINSSQLLLALARECGAEKMQLCRMTPWTELSDVQQEQETLFETAFENIENALTVR